MQQFSALQPPEMHVVLDSCWNTMQPRQMTSIMTVDSLRFIWITLWPSLYEHHGFYAIQANGLDASKFLIEAWGRPDIQTWALMQDSPSEIRIREG